MNEKAVFNATVCIVGLAIFLIHSIGLLLKKGKRKDERALLAFFLFTAIHFAVYLTFTLIKAAYTSDGFVMGFYTAFFVMNNLELTLLLSYAFSYVSGKGKAKRNMAIINLALLGVFVALDISNLFGRFFFYARNGEYTRANTMFLSQGYQLVSFIMVFSLTISDKRLDAGEKAAFSIYCFLPLGAIIAQNLLPGYAIAYLSIVVASEILFSFTSIRRSAQLEAEARKNKEAEIRLMSSQIQPHFIYNALSSVSTLIAIDPEKAQRTLDEFTEYLRRNLSLLSDTHCVLFSEELRHVETYLSLEKVRFDERLNVVYDIGPKDFLVPPLSVQPIVENAVKHGIIKKIEGGMVAIRTCEKEDAFVIEVIDDGVGFDTGALKTKGEGHVGIQNVSYRLATMCGGELEIDSHIGEGTKVTMTFPKRRS